MCFFLYSGCTFQSMLALEKFSKNLSWNFTHLSSLCSQETSVLVTVLAFHRAPIRLCTESWSLFKNTCPKNENFSKKMVVFVRDRIGCTKTLFSFVLDGFLSKWFFFSKKLGKKRAHKLWIHKLFELRENPPDNQREKLIFPVFRGEHINFLARLTLGQPAVCPRAIWTLTRAKSLCLCAFFLPEKKSVVARKLFWSFKGKGWNVTSEWPFSCEWQGERQVRSFIS